MVATDARSRIKIYLDTYIANANLTKDDDITQVDEIVVFDNANYPLLAVFGGTKNIDLIFSVGKPTVKALIGHDKIAYGYNEKVPITIYTLDKTGITGTKLLWKADREIRRIVEAQPLASYRSIERGEDSEQNLGAHRLQSSRYIINYTRDTVT